MIPEAVIPTNGHFQQFSLTSLLVLLLLCVFSCDSSISFIFLFFFPCGLSVKISNSALVFVGRSKSLISVKCPFPGTFSVVIVSRQGAFLSICSAKHFGPCCGSTLQFLLASLLYPQGNSATGQNSNHG